MWTPCVLHVASTKSIWTPPGVHVDSTWTPCIFHVLHMDSIWTPPGLHMDSTWTPCIFHGLHMDFMCIQTLLEIEKISCQCINFHSGQGLYYIKKPNRN